ncbi:formylglycine-generating enzyme family protein [Xanthomonas hortorum]|nr:formylglycine-generating enzyme family protein [Xanthomonas hortorum]
MLARVLNNKCGSIWPCSRRRRASVASLCSCCARRRACHHAQCTAMTNNKNTATLVSGGGKVMNIPHGCALTNHGTIVNPSVMPPMMPANASAPSASPARRSRAVAIRSTSDAGSQRAASRSTPNKLCTMHRQMPMLGSSEAHHPCGRCTRSKIAAMVISPNASATASNDATSNRAAVGPCRGGRNSHNACHPCCKKAIAFMDDVDRSVCSLACIPLVSGAMWAVRRVTRIGAAKALPHRRYFPCQSAAAACRSSARLSIRRKPLRLHRQRCHCLPTQRRQPLFASHPQPRGTMKHFLAFALIAAAAIDGAHAAPAVIAPPMVSIPAGEFLMGSTEPRIGDGSHNPAEGPPHRVQVQAFRMATYETTVAQFRQFIAATHHQTQNSCWEFDKQDGIKLNAATWNTAKHAPTDYHPVVCVTWEDATAYVQWLAHHTGRRFRLPSETEWEYAARAGTTTKYASGDAADALCAFANMKDRRFKTATQRDYALDMLVTDCDDGAEYTAVVGMYPANAFGLHDMMGNVAEWVADCQHPDYQGAPNDGSAWRDNCEVEGDYFITRGGSFASSRQVLRSAARGHGGRTNASSLGEGFRIAEDIGNCTASACVDTDAGFVEALESAQRRER